MLICRYNFRSLLSLSSNERKKESKSTTYFQTLPIFLLFSLYSVVNLIQKSILMRFNSSSSSLILDFDYYGAYTLQCNFLGEFFYRGGFPSPSPGLLRRLLFLYLLTFFVRLLIIKYLLRTLIQVKVLGTLKNLRK